MTSGVELQESSVAVCHCGEAIRVDVRAWCLDCYERREQWVLSTLAALGVEFQHVVVEEQEVCRSCNGSLAVGLSAVVVTIPLRCPEPVTVVRRKDS